MNIYDVIAIFPVTMTDEELKAALDAFTEEVAKHGGAVERTQVMGRRPFARPMGKKKDGIYVRLWVSLGADQVSPLLARLKLTSQVFRVQFRRVPSLPALPETSEKSEKSEEAAKGEEGAAAPAAASASGEQADG